MCIKEKGTFNAGYNPPNPESKMFPKLKISGCQHDASDKKLMKMLLAFYDSIHSLDKCLQEISQ